MKAILAQVSFFEAHFRVHRTKCAALTYPIPLPTSVAGIFGALCGWERRIDGQPKEVTELFFGAKLVRHDGIIQEHMTYKEVPKKVRGVAPVTIVNEPVYVIAMAGEGIEMWHDSLAEGSFKYLPYGGQSWFFPKDITNVRINETIETNEIGNYAPKDIVKDVKVKGKVFLHLFPVVHSFSADETFYFVEGNGTLVLDRNVHSVEGIGLYSLEHFKWMIG